jgi:membrane-associated phospholipid phosphatase
VRQAEWINLVYFSFIILLAWVRPYSLRRRWIVTAIGLAGILIVIFLTQTPKMLSPFSALILRDWFPVALMLLAYHQPGILFVSPNVRFQQWLQNIDQKMLNLEKLHSDRATVASFYAFTELAYLLCYPLVPFGLALLYVAGRFESANEFWGNVLPSAYFCYALVPLTQTLPPRSVPDDPASSLKPIRLRIFNLWILRHASIQVNTFPSAHVSASLAIALVILRYLPVAGIVLLALAISIAIGAVVGRYHYFVDVMAGALVASLVFLLRALLRL